MKEGLERFVELINGKARCIWVKTYEEAKFINAVKGMYRDKQDKPILFEWSLSNGMNHIPIDRSESRIEQEDDMPMPPIVLLGQIKEIQEEYGRTNLIFLKDFHQFIEDTMVKRSIRDLKEVQTDKAYCPIIVVSPTIKIPMELEKLFHIVEYDLPSSTEIRAILNIILQGLERKGESIIYPTASELDELVKTAVGLTQSEILETVKLSIDNYQRIDKELLNDAKMESIKRMDIIDYSMPTMTMDSIGGNESIKEWIEELKLCMTEEAMQFGCRRPKGYLAVGIPGCAKTATAEALAGEMNVPFLKLDMSKIMNRLVGESEKNISGALKLAENMAPCVLLVDEIEKSLSGK